MSTLFLIEGEDCVCWIAPLSSWHRCVCYTLRSLCGFSSLTATLAGFLLIFLATEPSWAGSTGYFVKLYVVIIERNFWGAFGLLFAILLISFFSDRATVAVMISEKIYVDLRFKSRCSREIHEVSPLTTIRSSLLHWSFRGWHMIIICYLIFLVGINVKSTKTKS